MNSRQLILLVAIGLLGGTTRAQDRTAKTQARSAVLSIEQAIAITTPSDLQFTLDGSRLAFTITLPVKGTLRRSEIWVLDVPTRKLRKFTHSAKADSSPRWSPDGRQLAFISARNDRPQIYLMPSDGGEAEVLTESKSAVTSFEWSPDGKHIAFIAPEPKTEAEEKKEKDKDDARVVNADFKPNRLWLLDTRTRKVRPLSTGRWSITEARWSPQGDRLFALATDDPDATTFRSRLFSLALDSTAMKELFAPPGPAGQLQVSPDGTTLGYLSARTDGPSPHDLFVFSLANGKPRNVTGTVLDRPINGYQWQTDDRLLLTTSDGFQSQYLALGPSGKPEPIAGLEVSPFGRIARTRSGLLAYVGQTATQLPEVWLKPPQGKSEPVTKFNAVFSKYGLVQPTIYRYRSFDGLEIEAALYKPSQTRASRLPLVVLVHGGPTGRWGDSYNAWAQLLVARGHAVVLPNVRGSTGYGWKFLTLNRADWGGGDFKDVMACVDDLIKKGIADSDRLGIGGWSYGGYMAAWAITQTNRFKASVVGACMSDLASEFGTEVGPAYDAWFYGVPYERLKDYIKSSPITYIKNARTPTLILHGEKDNVDPLGQAQQLYRGLKHYKVPCEFVIYPREGHGIREEKHVIDYHARLIRWFDTYLKPGKKE
jgi:dipeptidyl aminopeptidase/acylaminoacyl peptidase